MPTISAICSMAVSDNGQGASKEQLRKLQAPLKLEKLSEHGFVGHLAEPEQTSDKAVIVIMGGEQSLLPGIKIAERFADYGFIGLAVSLFGAEGLPDSPDRCPLEMFEKAVKYLKSERKIAHVSTYGQSMGSIFAVLTAQYIGNIENVIMVSPTHVPFEGVAKDNKHMTGHSVAIEQSEREIINWLS